MFKILSLVPKPIWLVSIGSIVAVMVVFTSYNKGVENTDNKWKLKIEEQVNKKVNVELIKVNTQLKRALEFKATKDEIIQEQEQKLTSSQIAYQALQERLNEVLSNPTTECSSLPDDEYRLYKDYLSQTK